MSSPLEARSYQYDPAASHPPFEVFYEDMTGLADTRRLIRRRGAEITRNEAFAIHEGVLEQTGKLALIDNLVLAPGRAKPPRNLEQYDLVTVVPRDPYEVMRSLSPVCSRLKTNGNVTFEYDRPSNEPYADAQIGLVLTYNNRGVALCAGGLSQSGPFIRQIQGISRAKQEQEDPQAYLYSSGLRGGFMWRDTLVRAWQSMFSPIVAGVLPDLAQQPIGIQSARNSEWIYSHAKDHADNIYQVIDPRKLARHRNNYDQVAIRLGGRPDHPKGDYILPMQGVQT